GTGAAVQALQADANTRLVAMADAFIDRLEASLERLRKSPVAERVAVDEDHRFAGFEGARQLVASDVDVVLLCAPPHFRPAHLALCIKAGKHVFAEKPVAVDAPGIRSVLATAEEAEKRNLTIVSGLCWRYETGMEEVIRQIHEGRIGEITSMETMRYAQGVGKLARRRSEWGDMEYQMRNWYYYTWLSGDFIVEQFVHELDKMAWVMHDEYPERCYCTGGRQTRVEPEYGHIYDHFFAVFEYANGVKLYAGTRHQRGCDTVRLDYVRGTKGSARLMRYTITGENPWQWEGKRTVMHQLEHDAMYAALRRGETINNGQYMAKSTMMAIMARMSAYSGKTITWEQAMNSKEDLSPPRYDWEVPLPEPPVAVPGRTPFV
ncbi:MAG TPA: Gfo/Idh/MocA family oxidoreductase, partial [Planctomycetaceae bacterium]|nr:Gfo/Idh/MocA family oxidoreductase [Planctomycetaceae bacterium]